MVGADITISCIMDSMVMVGYQANDMDTIIMYVAAADIMVTREREAMSDRVDRVVTQDTT